ncbi:hypothetical protein CFE70_008129 [Pyrenophora teres f. teres 0-1]|uniref:F-box domain-containing protein n=2 Tax=Pyrenophora teres f. teres TaxID=97479 RepID=E3S555_PYRTT|nr:hypothetical protein PTT_17731 [Pyrenophora teres f. teres 0-1]KAE8828846.1 hypothetical protein PTNB85_08034 [Pyrenophora teres f. teres]KAE8830008.1 hypothetical protein HRS9139_06632 [Pyrenophora teres f. teres]KAE8859756.1 hypothetical protein PTNB29_06987 [Pyrenophora teres f. teres]KAK1914518.1 hypothetical protein P3342_010507 [Pyrenophora teres f. teres]
MFQNLQIRPAKSHRRKPSLTIRSGVTKRRISAVSAVTANNVPSISFMENLFGAEFPEAFGNADGRPAESKKTILDLPSELLEIVCEYISKLDIKRLRLASKRLADSVYLRIDRVFISPNQANLAYLHTILAHPRYKGRVHEIVFDCTRLEEYSTLESFRRAIVSNERDTRSAIADRLDEAIEIYGNDSPQARLLEEEGMYQNEDGYLTENVKEILLRYEDDFARDVLARNAIMMSTEDSYAVYQTLYHQEQEIVQQNLDSDTLHQALAGFPKVKRVTLTSEAWWLWNVRPRYNTPFHRSLPPGFRKPLVFSDRDRPGPVRMHLGSYGPPQPDQSVCRGYTIILSALLSMKVPSIEEFIIDSENAQTGIPEHVFDRRLTFYNETRLMFQCMPLKRLRLSFVPCYCIHAIGSEHGQTNIIIQGLLAELKDLEHLDLDMRDVRVNHAIAPLIDDLGKANLKTLTLRNLAMSVDEFYEFLIALGNVQHITLYHMTHAGGEAVHWAHLFQRLKEYYTTSMQGTKPHYTIAEPILLEEIEDLFGTAVRFSHLVDEEVDAFLYGDSECPFLDASEAENEPNFFKRHVGWKVHDRDWTMRERMTEVCGREGMLKWEDEM